MKRKSIVLSDTEGETTKKAVLTLDETAEGLAGTLRLYNFSHEPNGVLSLGLYSGQKVFKAGLTRKSQMLYDFFVDVKEIPQKFSCAVVNFQNAQPKPVLFGSSEGSADDVYASIISEVSSAKSFEKTKEVLDKYGVDFDEEEKAEIEKDIDENLCHENCENCIYKKFFYENSQEIAKEQNDEKQEQNFDYKSQIFGGNFENENEKNVDLGQNAQVENLQDAKTNSFSTSMKNQSEDNFENPFENGKQNDENKDEKIIFFDRLKPQIDKLFENNPAENNLQNIFPSSKWVKVEYEDEGDFFVFGLLYDEDGNVKYVCYGVPAVFDENPPEELAGYPIWLPLDDEKGFGYWMTYQDAVTGEPLKAIID